MLQAKTAQTSQTSVLVILQSFKKISNSANLLHLFIIYPIQIFLDKPTIVHQPGKNRDDNLVAEIVLPADLFLRFPKKIVNLPNRCRVITFCRHFSDFLQDCRALSMVCGLVCPTCYRLLLLGPFVFHLSGLSPCFFGSSLISVGRYN